MTASPTLCILSTALTPQRLYVRAADRRFYLQPDPSPHRLHRYRTQRVLWVEAAQLEVITTAAPPVAPPDQVMIDAWCVAQALGPDHIAAGWEIIGHTVDDRRAHISRWPLEWTHTLTAQVEAYGLRLAGVRRIATEDEVPLEAPSATDALRSLWTAGRDLQDPAQVRAQHHRQHQARIRRQQLVAASVGLLFAGGTIGCGPLLWQWKQTAQQAQQAERALIQSRATAERRRAQEQAEAAQHLAEEAERRRIPRWLASLDLDCPEGLWIERFRLIARSSQILRFELSGRAVDHRATGTPRTGRQELETFLHQWGKNHPELTIEPPRFEIGDQGVLGFSMIVQTPASAQAPQPTPPTHASESSAPASP